MDAAVIGAGYVGAVTDTCLALLGHDVNLVETAPERLRSLQAGHVPFFEPGLEPAGLTLALARASRL